MHIFLDNFQLGRKYSAQIASHQAELRREETFTDQKSLNISSLQIYYLNLNSISDFGRDSERAYAVLTDCTFCGVANHYAEQCFKRIRQEKKKLVWLMFHPIDKWNVHLENDLDVDLKIT